MLFLDRVKHKAQKPEISILIKRIVYLQNSYILSKNDEVLSCHLP